MKVTVLGVGHGGIAMAADLAASGHEVRLAAVPEHAHGLVMVEALHGIYLDGITSGGRKGFVSLPTASTDPVAAIKGADVVMVVVPAFGQRPYMEILAEHVEDGQCIVFNPGKFASLEFALLIGERPRVLFGDTETLIYAARMRGPDHVEIRGVKRSLPVAAYPAERTDELVKRVGGLFPQVHSARNVVECALNDPGSVLHPVSTLMNASRIEEIGPYRTGHYGVTPSVGRVIDALDAERTAVAAALGLVAQGLVDVAREVYGTTGETAYDALMQISAHDHLMTPGALDHRYITEEVPYGLVPIIELARALGVSTPGLDAVVTLSELALGRSFRESGRNLRTLGLSGCSREELLARFGGRRG